MSTPASNARTRPSSSPPPPSTTPATITLLRWPVPVSALRILALLAAAAALAFTALTVTRTRRTPPAPGQPSADTDPLQHRAVPARFVDLGDCLVIDVADPPALTRIAERYDLPITHLPGTEADLYLTVHGHTAYRYTQPHYRDPGPTATAPGRRSSHDQPRTRSE